MDELVAGLSGVRNDQVTGPFTPGARELLASIMAEGTAPSAGAPRRRRYRRVASGLVLATAASICVIIALGVAGPGAVRHYANTAVSIEHMGSDYRVHIKNVFADQRRFHDAFAELGLNVKLSIVPVSPGYERRIISVSTMGDRIATVLDCPHARQDACPLTLTLSGAAVRRRPTEITIGRAARPGEIYRNQHPGAGDNPPSLKLTGHTVADALARLRERKLTATYMLGRFHHDGSGSAYRPPTAWRPRADRRVTGAWLSSSASVTLLISPQKSDPARSRRGPDVARD